MPWVCVLERYPRIHLMACQWHSCGDAKNWATILMTNIISSYVNIRYCKELTTCLHSFSSWHGLPTDVMSTFAAIGVFDGRRFVRDALCKRLTRYSYWSKWRPQSNFCTWTPKKYLRLPSFRVANSNPILSMICCTNNSSEPIMTMLPTLCILLWKWIKKDLTCCQWSQ